MARNNSLSKLPSALSDEELLKQLDSPEQIQKEAPNNVVSFLLFFKIEPGAFLVKKHVLYTLYLGYTKESVGRVEFDREVGNYILSKIYRGCPYFYINYNSFDIGSKTFELFQKSKHITKSPRFNSHFKNFIQANNLEDGNHWIPAQLFYQEYREWCKTINRQRPLSRTNFYKFLKLYFKKEKQVGNIKYIGIKRKIHENKKENNKEAKK